MKLKLQLVQNGKIIFEMPLFPRDWSHDRLEDELDGFETEFPRLSKFFDALSHQTRLRMMKRIMEAEDRTITFTNFMHDLHLNPKIVWENTKKLGEGGLITKVERGKYRCSEFGQSGFMLMSLALRRLLDHLEEVDF